MYRNNLNIFSWKLYKCTICDCTNVQGRYWLYEKEYIMKNELTALSGAEGEVLRILWDLGRGTVQSVLDKMPAGRDVAYATVQTLLRRLEKKGYVGHERKGKAHVFYPAVERADVLDSAVGTFVERLFGGNSAGLVHFLAEHGKIGADDIEKLKDIVSDNDERD